MPSVTEVRAKDPAGGLKYFCILCSGPRSRGCAADAFVSMLRALRFNSTAVRSIRRFSDAKQRSRYQREQLLQRVYGHQCSDGELEAIVRGFGSKEVPQMSTNEMTDFDLVLWQRESDLQAWRDDSSKVRCATV